MGFPVGGRTSCPSRTSHYEPVQRGNSDKGNGCTSEDLSPLGAGKHKTPIILDLLKLTPIKFNLVDCKCNIYVYIIKIFFLFTSVKILCISIVHIIPCHIYGFTTLTNNLYTGFPQHAVDNRTLVPFLVF